MAEPMTQAELDELGTPPFLGEFDAARFMDMVPAQYQRGLARWILCGVRPGGFLQAFIANDLFGSLAHYSPDGTTSPLAAIQGMRLFLYNCVDSRCFGSREKLDAWAARFGEPPTR